MWHNECFHRDTRMWWHYKTVPLVVRLVLKKSLPSYNHSLHCKSAVGDTVSQNRHMQEAMQCLQLKLWVMVYLGFRQLDLTELSSLSDCSCCTLHPGLCVKLLLENNLKVESTPLLSFGVSYNHQSWIYSNAAVLDYISSLVQVTLPEPYSAPNPEKSPFPTLPLSL